MCIIQNNLFEKSHSKSKIVKILVTKFDDSVGILTTWLWKVTGQIISKRVR